MKRFYKVLVWVIFMMPLVIFFLAVYFGIPERIVRYNYSVVGLQFLAMLITTILCAVASWKSDSRFWTWLFIYFVAQFAFGIFLFYIIGYETMIIHDDKWVMPIIFFVLIVYTIATIVYSLRLIVQANQNKKKTNFFGFNKSLLITLVPWLFIFLFIYPVLNIFVAETHDFSGDKFVSSLSFSLPIALLFLSNIYLKATYSKDAWTNDLKYAYWGTSTFCFSNIGFFCMVLLTKFYEPIYFDHVPQNIFMYLLAATIDSLFVVSLGLISLGALKRIEMAESERKITADNISGAPLSN